MKTILRIATYVFGLVTLYGFIAVVLTLIIGNRLAFVADSDRPGSTVLLFIVGALPALIASSLVGVVTATVFRDLGRPLSIVVGLVIGFWYAGSFSFHWHIANLDHESRIGWSISSILVTFFFLLAYQIAAISETRREKRRSLTPRSN